jgi:hypothetical protein
MIVLKKFLFFIAIGIVFLSGCEAYEMYYQGEYRMVSEIENMLSENLQSVNPELDYVEIEINAK